MRGSRRSTRLAVALSALMLSGCGARRIVAVDPFPCGDAGLSGCAGLLDDLVGFWRLDDAGDSATIRDFSGWANDGTLIGIDPKTAWVPGGPEDRALAPQGRGYVVVPHSPSIDSITMQVTVAAWIYIDGAITDYATAISRQIGTTYDQHYHLSINSSQFPALFLETPASKQVYIGGPATIPKKTWVHLAATYDGTTGRLYVNGVQVAHGAVTGPFAPDSNPVVLSGNANASAPDYTERIPGRLDDVMLYRRVLAPEEIARLTSGALVGWGGAMHDTDGQ